MRDTLYLTKVISSMIIIDRKAPFSNDITCFAFVCNFTIFKDIFSSIA